MMHGEIKGGKSEIFDKSPEKADQVNHPLSQI